MSSHATPHATFVVDNAGDTNGSCATGNAHTCSLRSAINAANANTGHIDAVVVPAGLHVTLNQGPLLVFNSVLISGGKGSSINGDGSEVFDVYNFPSVTISGLRIYGGYAYEGGGVYCSSGSLVLANDVIFNNFATYEGGGVYTAYDCALWVDGSTIVANTAESNGGGIYSYGSAVISRTAFGGALSALGNSAANGGGLYNYDGNDVVTNCTFTHNKTYSTSFGEGTGIYNDENMEISGSTISANTQTNGGDGAGIYNGYDLIMSNSAINSNAITGTANSNAAGLYDDGDITLLTNVSFTGNSARVTSGANLTGGAVYSDAYTFTWTGGSIANQVNGTPGQSDYIGGGAMYVDADQATVTGISITNTVNRAGPAEGVYGGAIYNDYYAHFSQIKITGTTNSGTYIDGGAFVNDSKMFASSISISTTKNSASNTTGGSIEGGGFTNYSYSNLNGLSIIGTTDSANLATTPTPSTVQSYVEGGALFTDEEFQGQNISISGVNAVASGGNGYVEGGAIYSDEMSIFDNTQATGVKVTADSSVEGGLFVTYSQLMANNLTLGSSSVRVLGGIDAGTPYIDGSIFYSSGHTSVVNGTFDNVTASAPSGSSADNGVYNDSQMQLTNTTIANDNIVGPNSYLLYSDSSFVSLRNSIVADLVASKNCHQGSGTIVSNGYNIDSGITCHFNNVGDHKATNPQVLALANNGGPIFTAALKKPTSPAINHGSNIGCPTRDARGVSRPQHGACDIGAYELV